jgi:hypothetical protein
MFVPGLCAPIIQGLKIASVTWFGRTGPDPLGVFPDFACSAAFPGEPGKNVALAQAQFRLALNRREADLSKELSLVAGVWGCEAYAT